MRRILPQRRASRKLRHAVLEPVVHGSPSVSMPTGKRRAKSSLTAARPGQDIQSTARDVAVVLSLALQHGVPPETIRHAVTRGASEEPASILGAVVDSITTKSFSGGV